MPNKPLEHGWTREIALIGASEFIITELEDIVRDLPKQRVANDQLKINERDLPSLYAFIDVQLRTQGFTLKDIQKHAGSNIRWNNNTYLAQVLEYYDALKKEMPQPIPPDPPKAQNLSLEDLCNDVINRRDTLWNEATASHGEDLKKTVVHFLTQIRQVFRAQGRSLSELLQPENRALCKEFISRSTRLNLAMALYYQSIKQAQNTPAPAREDINLDKINKNKASEEANKAVQNKQGLFTRAGVKPEDRNASNFKLKLKKIKFDNHPDRNKEGNLDQFVAADELSKLNDLHQLENYLELLEKYREQERAPGPKS